MINFFCPHCRCTDRDRHLWLYINKLGLFDSITESATILHVAPEFPIVRKILLKTKRIILGDLYPEKYKNHFFPVHKIDLTHIDVEDNIFALFIANRILEHIVKYEDVIKEIYRVLKKKGIAILQTPFSPMIYNNFEDPMINTDEEREIFYGQNNHVRLFGLRLFNDLKEVGFKSLYIEHNNLIAEYDPVKYGVNSKEGLILAIK